MPRAGWIVLLLPFAVWWMVASNEAALSNKARTTLAAADMDGVVLTIEGRDAVVEKTGGRDPDMIEEALYGVGGVRRVDFMSTAKKLGSDGLSPATTSAQTGTTVPATTAVSSTTTPATTGATTATTAPATTTTATTTTTSGAAAEEPGVHAVLQDGMLTISGAVSSPAAAEAVAQVIALVYAPFVDNQLTVAEGVEAAEWEGRVAGALAVLPIVGTAELTIMGDEAVIAGEARTDAHQARLTGALAQALGTSTALVDELEVSGAGSPYYRFRADDGHIILDGRLPGDDVVAAIVDAAADVYGAGNVTNNLVVDGDIERAFTVFRAPLLFTQFAPIPNWTLEVDGDQITGALRGGATFAYNSAELTPELKVLLQTAAGVLLRNPALGVVIEGHTDSSGSAQHNQRLSQRRADAGAETLSGLGIPEARINAVGFGETRPIAPNNTEEGRALNRRLDFAFSSNPE